MQKTISYLKPLAVSASHYVRKNPHMGLATLLFIIGILLLWTKASMISGALFGAGASLLGAWITELNNRRSNAEDKARRETEARMYLAPELNRTIERILYIHGRAISNFSSASFKHEKRPNDLREDFIPYMPALYPNVVQFRDLPGDDAIALIAFYDSLNELDKFVNGWWEREGQLPVNIFNMLLTLADKSLSLAEACIHRFELERLYPPQYKSRGHLLDRIKNSKTIAEKTSESHLTRYKAKSSKLTQ